MKPYHELTCRGQLRRLRRLALEVLNSYNLDVKKVSFFTIETNTMFRVDTETGGKYVLRIYSDEETTLLENQAEMFWLDAIIRDTDIKVCEPVRRRDGCYITVSSADGVPGERRCVLFRWVPGRPLEHNLNPIAYYQLGQTLAKLHNHAQGLNPLPASIHPKQWDKVFYYPDEPIVYNTSRYRHYFPPERVVLLDEVIIRADTLFRQLYANREGKMLIHGDLHYWNVHLYRGELYVIDFEDVMLGYPVQDVAVTLSYGRDRPDYDDLRAAFREGYSDLRFWHGEGDSGIETLIATQTVMFINYVARIDPEPQAYIEQRCERLQEYMRVYG